MLPSALGHYRILRALGAGGMGEIYLAEDTRLGRNVALKVLTPALADDPERRERFEREARAVAALNHPNIVTLHSVERHEGVMFLTMELVEGHALTDLIPAQGMPVEQWLDVAIPLADAVAAAHQRGITHRDLKPGNVMVTNDGRLKVLDFGLAKLQGGVAGDDATATAADLTMEGRILGTVAYMSPEQAQGKPVDARSDIFSIGILLYEMATGARPFAGDNNASILSAILRDTPPTVMDVRGDLPRELSRILTRCLAKDPEARYQTAKDLRNDLRLLKEEVDSGRAITAAPIVASSGRTRRVWSASARYVAGAVVIIAIAAAWWWGRRPAPPSPFTTVSMRRLTNTGDASVAAIAPNGRYVAHVVGARGRPSLWLRQVATSGNVQILPPMEGAYGGLTFSADGDQVVYLFYPPNTYGSVYQVPLLGGPPHLLIEDTDTVPAYSPDGRRIAFVRDTGQGVYSVMLASADGADQRTLATRPARDPYCPTRLAWSPDGTLVAVFAGFMPFHRSRLVLLEVATGKERAFSEERFDLPGQLAWMPDGHSLVFDAVERGGFGASGQLWSIAYPEGTVRRITMDVASYASLDAAADGRTLAAVQYDVRGSLWVADAGDTAHPRAITNESAGRDGGVGLDWTGDGEIVYSALTQESWDLWVSDARGQARRQLTTDPGVEAVPAVLADGRSVAFIARPNGEDHLRLRAIDLDGTHQRDLFAEPVMPGYLQATGDALFFRRAGGRATTNPVQRLPLLGGTPVPIFANPTKLPPHFNVRRISSDQHLVLGTMADPKVPGVTMVVLPVEGGPPLRTFPFASSAAPPLTGGFGWAPGNRAVEALLLRDGAVNLWRFPLDGSAPVRLTSFTSDEILAFAWSRDGKRLALSRGRQSADVVLITQDK